jgi:hypothetical protein
MGVAKNELIRPKTNGIYGQHTLLNFLMKSDAAREKGEEVRAAMNELQENRTTNFAKAEAEQLDAVNDADAQLKGATDEFENRTRGPQPLLLGPVSHMERILMQGP